MTASPPESTPPLPGETAGNPGWLRKITRFFRRSTQVLEPAEADLA